MATTTALSLDLGIDHQFKHVVLNAAETAAVNCASWQLSWMVKRRLRDADDDALVTKTTGSPDGLEVTGAFHSDPATNTQRAVVTIEAEDTEDLAPGPAFWELKRTDDGFETVLGSGTLSLTRRVHRA